MKITYFVHGTTEDNEAGIASGWKQAMLSETGRVQAKDLAKMVADISFEVVYSSDLQRAIDSAELAFGDTHELRRDYRLKEANYGIYDGTSIVFKEGMARYIDRPYPNGESYHDVEKRMRSFIDDVKAEGLNHIGIVAHEAPQLALEVIANNKSWEQAMAENWRNQNPKAWQPGWIYVV